MGEESVLAQAGPQDPIYKHAEIKLAETSFSHNAMYSLGNSIVNAK